MNTGTNHPTIQVVINLTNEEYSALMRASVIKQRAYFDQATRYVVKGSFNDIENGIITQEMRKMRLATPLNPQSSIPLSSRPGIDYPAPSTPKDPSGSIDSIRSKVTVEPIIHLDSFIYETLVSLAEEQKVKLQDIIEEALNTWSLPQTSRPKN